MTAKDPWLLVIVPRPVPPEQLALRQAQLESVALGPGFRFDFRPVKVAPVHFVSHHDYLLGDLAVFEAALDAQEEGYAAVCIDTMTDSSVAPLRSVLDIPVIGPGRVSYLTALMLGQRFSIVTMWDAWKAFYRKSLDEARLADRCASIRAINVEPDGHNLLIGKEDRVLPALEEAARRCIEEDGADVICMGSTTIAPGPRLPARPAARAGHQPGAPDLKDRRGVPRSGPQPQPRGLSRSGRRQDANDQGHAGGRRVP